MDTWRACRYLVGSFRGQPPSWTPHDSRWHTVILMELKGIGACIPRKQSRSQQKIALARRQHKPQVYGTCFLGA